jgi:hypothetical protein
VSLFSKIGHALAAPVKGAVHLVTGPGKAISNIGKSVAPVYHAAATGAGAIGGLALGGPLGAISGAQIGDKLGNIGDDALAGRSVPKNLGSNLGGAAIGAAGLGLSGGLGGALSKIPGASSVGSAISKIPGVSQVGSLLGIGGSDGGAIPDSAFGTSGGGLGTSLSSLLGTAGKFLTGNGGLNALGVAQGVSSVLDQKKANDYANKAANAAEQGYTERAPLRAKSLAALTTPTAPDVSRLLALANDPGNPYASRS